METISYPILDINEMQTIFSVNDIQVIFNTDIKTGQKLENDEILKEYLRAVVHANLLEPQGIENTDKITSIQRLSCIDENKAVIALDITTNVQQGVEELRCIITEERNGNEEIHSSEDSSLNQQISDIQSGPSLRWNSEMTTLLIKIRGEMDREFAKAKYKFRLWQKVAAKLKLHNIEVSAKDCDDKWRNIVATYRKNIDKLKCFGDNTVRWEYFTAMDNILKGTKDVADQFSISSIVEEDHVVKLMNELTSPEVEVKSEPFEIIDVSADQSSIEEIDLNDEEFPCNFIITRTSSGEKRKWTTEQCLMLIFLRDQAEIKFKNSYEKTPYLWKELTVQMKEKFLINFDPHELESVWNHCNVNYEINLENLKSKGVRTVKWKYFAIMDEIRGGTREISEISIPKPGENLLKEFQKLQLKNNLRLAKSMLTNSDSTKDDTDSEDYTCSSLSGITWSSDMVKMLISLKKIIEQDIIKNKISRKKQWWIIVRRFRTMKNIKLTEEACEEKWRSLVRTYKKNLIYIKKRGEIAVKWPYFWKMWGILGNSVFEKEHHSVHKPRLNDNLMYDFETQTSPMILNDNSIDDSEDIEYKESNDQNNLKEMISDLYDSHNNMLQEMISIQNKKIEELHQEQLNIKSLLMQLLQKFP